MLNADFVTGRFFEDDPEGVLATVSIGDNPYVSAVLAIDKLDNTIIRIPQPSIRLECKQLVSSIRVEYCFAISNPYERPSLIAKNIKRRRG